MRVHCHIFSGLFGFLPGISAGVKRIEELVDDLKVNYGADLHDWKRGDRAFNAIMATYQPGDKIVLIGHSQGARTIVELAEDLNKMGVDVDYLVGIDPTLAVIPFMPHNVKRVDVFRATMGFVAFFRRLSGGNAGVFRYGGGWPGVSYITTIPGTAHVEISKHPGVHKRILDTIRGLLV